MTAGPLDQHNLLEPLAWREWFSSHKKAGGKCRPPETFEKVAQPLFRGGLHESFVSISCEIVGEAFARSVIPEVHAPGNDGISFYSAAFGRRNSLQEGFFDKLSRTPHGTSGSVLHEKPGCVPSGNAPRSFLSYILRPRPIAKPSPAPHRPPTMWVSCETLSRAVAASTTSPPR